MKLYLTSYRIPDVQVLTDLVSKPANKTKVALIPNAKDYYAPRAKRVKARLVGTYLKALGFTVTVVDLSEYHHAPATLRDKLSAFDMLWVMGGNTFCLREAMKHSGFDKIVREVVEAGVVFAGESAGACVAGTDLKGIEEIDDPEFAETVIWEGLRLTPYYLVPHAENKDIGAEIQKVINERGNDPSMVILKDSQAWVVNGDDAWKITGADPNVGED